LRGPFSRVQKAAAAAGAAPGAAGSRRGPTHPAAAPWLGAPPPLRPPKLARSPARTSHWALAVPPRAPPLPLAARTTLQPAPPLAPQAWRAGRTGARCRTWCRRRRCMRC
jgi:hypothetical protein